MKAWPFKDQPSLICCLDNLKFKGEDVRIRFFEVVADVMAAFLFWVLAVMGAEVVVEVAEVAEVADLTI